MDPSERNRFLIKITALAATIDNILDQEADLLNDFGRKYQDFLRENEREDYADGMASQAKTPIPTRGPHDEQDASEVAWNHFLSCVCNAVASCPEVLMRSTADKDKCFQMAQACLESFLASFKSVFQTPLSSSAIRVQRDHALSLPSSTAGQFLELLKKENTENAACFEDKVFSGLRLVVDHVTKKALEHIETPSSTV